VRGGRQTTDRRRAGLAAVKITLFMLFWLQYSRTVEFLDYISCIDFDIIIILLLYVTGEKTILFALSIFSSCLCVSLRL